MFELFQFSFVKNAFIGGILLAILLSVVSLFIYLRNWSFITVGISHATFGGLAIGLYLGISPVYTAIVFAVLIGFLIGYISRKGSIHEDTSIGILFSVSMALGVIILTSVSNYTNDLFVFLFGNILTISQEDLYILTAFLIFSLAFIKIFFQKIMFCCYNEEVAYVSGINTTFYYYMLIFIISVSIVLAVKLVGVILTSAMLILPTATAKQFAKHYRAILVIAIILSIIVVILGILASYKYDIPSGATIVLIYGLIFFSIIGIKKGIEVLEK